MKKIGDYVIYRKEVCQIKEMKENYRDKEDYYRLVPVEDPSLHIDIPITNTSGFLRDLITKEEVERIINKMPEIKTITTEDKLLENEYKNLMNSNSLEDYVRIIKTTYLRNKKREENKKKISDKDYYYFNLAEKYLYNEFSIVLNKTYEETKKYVLEKLESLIK